MPQFGPGKHGSEYLGSFIINKYQKFHFIFDFIQLRVFLQLFFYSFFRKLLLEANNKHSLAILLYIKEPEVLEGPSTASSFAANNSLYPKAPYVTCIWQ